MARQELVLSAREQRQLLEQMRETHDARVYRRSLAIRAIGLGKPLAEVARMLGVSRRTAYYWLEEYAREHNAADLLPADRSGRPSLWTEEARALIVELLTSSPAQRGYYAMNWTVPLLIEELWHAIGRRFSDDTVRRELHRLGYVWKRPRYVLEPDPEREKKEANSQANTAFAAP